MVNIRFIYLFFCFGFCGRCMQRPYWVVLLFLCLKYWFGLRGHGTPCPYFILYVYRTHHGVSLLGYVYRTQCVASLHVSVIFRSFFFYIFVSLVGT